jgi:DNA-binding response OmpR family regulator
MRLLFVENHAVFAQTVVEAFLGGFEVIVVPSLAEARRRFAAGAFDAALVDFDLDDGKGEEIVRELRGRGFRGKIVAVSSHDEGNARLVAAGASSVCKKGDFRRIREHLPA